MVLTATSGTKPIIVSAGHVQLLVHQREKKGSTVQYGYRKWGTHARVFSQTLAHGNSKTEIRQWAFRNRQNSKNCLFISINVIDRQGPSRFMKKNKYLQHGSRKCRNNCAYKQHECNKT